MPVGAVVPAVVVVVVVVAAATAGGLELEAYTGNVVVEEVLAMLNSVIVLGWKSFGHERSSAYPILCS